MRDKYGRERYSKDYMMGDLEPYIIEENSATGITYIRYDDKPLGAIRRITETVVDSTTTTTVEVAYGAWALRGSLTYSPVNSVLDV